MAVKLFKITVDGTSYIYTDEKTWLDSNDNSVTAPDGISVGNTKKNSDGTYDVTVSKTAFSTTISSNTNVTLEDLNADDRQIYRLALGSGYTSNEIYGARQSVNYSASGIYTTATITDINAGLLVNVDGKSITYETPTGGNSASVVITNLTNPSTSNVTISGRTIIIGDDALPTTGIEVKITTDATDAYSLALGSVSAGRISEYTEKGWESVASGGGTAHYVTAGYTTGYRKKSNTTLEYSYNNTGGDTLFSVNGLSEGTSSTKLGDYFSVQTGVADNSAANVSLQAAGFSALLGNITGTGTSNAITITDASGGPIYQFAIGAGVNTDAHAVTEGLNSNYFYTTAGNSAYANLTNTSVVTAYKEVESKSFGLSGLSAGMSAAVSVTGDATNGFTVTIGQSALAKQNVFTYGDDKDLVTLKPADNVTQAILNTATASLTGSVLTYVAASAASAGYAFQNNQQVIYYDKQGAGGESFSISNLNGTTTVFANGIIASTLGTITPEVTGANVTTFNIALAQNASTTSEGSTMSPFVITAGNNSSLNYKLTYAGASAYGSKDTPNASLSSLNASLTGGKYQYTYVSQYTPAYLQGASQTSASVLAVGQSETYTYHAAGGHSTFTLSGLSNAVFGTTELSGANAVDYFTVNGTSVIFTQKGISALLTGAKHGESLTISENYLMSNPTAIVSHSAAFSGSVTGGVIQFKDAYNTSGWSAATATTNGYSSAFTFHRYTNKNYAFSLSGLTGLDGSSFTYTAEGGGISFTKDNQTYAFGTLSYPAGGGSGIISLDATVFDTITGISSITLTDNDASDSILYTFALGEQMPAYGVSNMRATEFKASSISGATGVSSYTYVSGGLSEGYGLYFTGDKIASASAGVTTVTKYAGSASSTFTISGLSSGIQTAAVLDYVVIDSKEKLEYYVTKGDNNTHTLRKGNYLLTANLELDYTLTIAAETYTGNNASGGNVAIDLNGHKISVAGISAFNVTGGDLIINDSQSNGSIAATTKNSTKATAIAITGGNLIVNGGKIEGTEYAIDSAGTVVINGGTILGKGTESNATTGTGINVTGGKLIVASGSVTGGTNAINNSGGMVYVTGGTVTGGTGGAGVVASSIGSVNVLDGTLTGMVGLSVASTTGIVNVLGGSVTGSGSYAITNADDTAVNIGRATIGSLSSSTAGGFSIFTDYSGNTYATINGRQQTTTGSYSSYFTYSSGFSSILNSIEYPTFSASSAVIVGASAGGYITLNRAALAGISTASLTNAGKYAGLALGSDVTEWSGSTRPTDPTRNTGWFISDASVANDSSIDKATYQATHYLESWQVSNDKKSVTRYDETGGATILLSGLSNIVANGTSMALTDASLGSFFNVSLTGGTDTGDSAVTKYTLTIANNESLLSALDGGESLTFTFNDTVDNLGASGFSLAFATDIDSLKYNLAIGAGSSVITKNYTHSALASLTGTGAFLYTASGVEDHYLLENPATSESTNIAATLTHVDTVGLQQFSLSGLGSKFSKFSASATTTGVDLIGSIAGGSAVTIGTITLSTNTLGYGGTSLGTVTLYEEAFKAGASQTITLTDLNMDDDVYYVLSQGSLAKATDESVKIAQTLQPFAAGGTSYTFILGGSAAYYTVNKSGSAVGSQSSSYILYTPQVGGQSFILTGLTSGLTASTLGSNLVSIMSGTTQVGSISFSDRNIINDGNRDSVAALVTLTDVAAMGTSLNSGQSKAFAFKDSDSLDGIAYSFSLGSAFNQVSVKPANPDVAATFASVANGYTFTAPAYNNYTLSKGSGSYVYYAKENADSLSITGLSVGLAASGAYGITTTFSKGESGITTISASGTETGTLFTVERAGGSLNVVVYEDALQSVAGRTNISVAGAQLAGLSFDGTLGQSGVQISSGAFGSIAGGSFTYQAAAYQDYYSVGTRTNGTITATHYAGAGGQSFTFSGLSTGNLSAIGLNVAGLSSAIKVNSTFGTATAGGFSITKYTFEVDSINLLKQIPQGESLAVKFTGNDTVSGGLSLTIASGIITTGEGAAREREKYVAGRASLAPYAEYGKAGFKSNDGGSFTYTAKLEYYDWFQTDGATIKHNPQEGGQQFSISGIAASLTSDTYSIVQNEVRAHLSDDSIVSFMQVNGASVYLTEAAFGSGSTITLTDGYDGTGNEIEYKIVGSSLTGYLNEYDGNYGGASFASVTNASAGTYNFTASGINAGISIAGSSTAAGLSITTATYIDATGSEQFIISGLSAGMSGFKFDYTNGTSVSLDGGASVLKVTGASSAFNVMVYSGALSTGRGDISLTSGTDGVNYSLSLASDLLLIDGKPSVSAEGTGDSITVAANATSAVWTAPTYKDYYSLTSDTFAKHYESSGGQSFIFSVTNSQNNNPAKFKSAGTITVVHSGDFGDNNQYGLTSVVFGVSKAALAGLSADYDMLSVGTQSGVTYTGNYALSFVGKTSDSVYSSDAIMTTKVSDVAKFASVKAGEYNFAASVGQYDWYEHNIYDKHTIIYHAKTGGESFSITGMNTGLGALTYDTANGQIKSGNTLVGMIEMATLSGTTVQAANVYLTEAAFGSGSKVTLTDLDSTDGISYALKLYTGTSSPYLMANGENSVAASFTEQTAATTAGTYLYTASINGAYASLGTSKAGTNQTATVLEYSPTSGGESFVISGLASSLNATVDDNSNIISNKVTIGTVGDDGVFFTLQSPLALGTLAGGATRNIILTDNNIHDSVDYKLNLGSAFNLGKESTASITASIKEEGTNTGTYDVQVGGTSAWSNVYLQENYSYQYHAPKNATTYVVTGLAKGLTLSAASVSAVFGVSSVILNDSVIPAGELTTVQILNNSTPVSLMIDSNTIVNASLQGNNNATMATDAYTAQTYKPWYVGNVGGESLKIYPSVGGQSFVFTGFTNMLKGTANYEHIINSDKNGTITANVTLNEETGQIDKYIFTVGGSGVLLDSSLTQGNEISVSLTGGTSVNYALDLSGVIAVGTGSAVSEASLTFDGGQHKYTGTGMSAHAEILSVAGGLSMATAYTYHEAINPVNFYINNLNGNNLSLGSDVIVLENWAGDTLSSVGITLTSGALPASTTSDIYTTGINATTINNSNSTVSTVLPASIVAFALSAGSLEANNFSASFAGENGDYYYRNSGRDKGYYVSTSNKSRVQYSSVASGGQSFTLTGLSTGLGELSVSGGGSLYANISGESVLIGTFVSNKISITNPDALGNRTFKLTDYVDRAGETFDYELTIADSIKTVAGTSSAENVAVNAFGDYAGKLLYNAAVSSAHYTGSESAATGTGSVGDVRAEYIYTYTPSTKLGYDFYFDGSFNSNEYNDVKYSYSVKDGVITATEANNSASSVTLATITGGTSGTISINAAAIDTTKGAFYLTYTGAASAGYKLALGEGMSAASIRSETTFEETATGSGHYSYKEAGNSEGYAVVSYSGTGNHGGSAIEYTSLTGGNNFDLSGLKGGMSLVIGGGSIYGTIYDTSGGTSVPIGTYNPSANGKTYIVTLNDNAFDYSAIATKGGSVVLGNVSNEYDTTSKFGIGQFTLNIDSDSVKPGTDYTFKGASFAEAVPTLNGYSITYQSNPKDAYWRNNGRNTAASIRSFTYMPTRGASDLFSLGTFSVAVTGSDFTVNNGNSLPGQGTYEVNVADSLLPNSVKTTITLTDSDTNDSYNFYFAAGDGQSDLVFASGSHPDSVEAGFKGNIFKALSRPTYTEIGSNSTTLTYVPAAGGESFSITGLAYGLSLAGQSVYALMNSGMSLVGTLDSTGSARTLTLNTTAVLGSSFANGESVAITLTDLAEDGVAYKLSLGSAFNVNGTSVRSDVLEKIDDNGSYTYKVGALSAYTTKKEETASVTSYIYYAKTSSEDFSITGLSVGLTGTNSVLSDASSLAAYFEFSGQSVSITEKTFAKTEGTKITFNGDADSNGTAYSLVNPEERATLAPNFEGTGNAILYRDTTITKGFSGVAGENATLTYASVRTGAELFTVSGLSSTFNAASMSYSVIGGAVVAGTSTIIGSYADNTLTLNAKGLEGAKGTVSISGTTYNLELAGVSTTAGSVGAQWVDDSTGGISYVMASNNEYWNPVTPNKAYTYVAKSGGDPVFGIHGLSANAASLNAEQVEAVSMQGGGYSVVIDDDFINKTPGERVSITGNNALYFEGEISITSVAGYSSLQLGGFSGTTYSIPAYSDQMIAVNTGKNNAYYFAKGSETTYTFGISAGDFPFNGTNFTPSLISGDSVLFTQTSGSKAQAARLDKSTKTVYIYNGIFGSDNDSTTVQLTDTAPEDLAIAAVGTGSYSLPTDPGTSNNSGWGNYGSNDLLYLAGYNNTPYFSKTDDKTLTYVSVHGGDYFKLNGAPESLTLASLKAGVISVASKDGANYVFTINNQSLLDATVLSGLSIAVRQVGTYTKNAGLSLTVAFAASNANNEPLNTDATYKNGVYTAVGTLSYYKNTSVGSNSTAWASLSYVAAVAGESFSISGLTSRASLGSDGTSIVVSSTKLAGISFTGEKNDNDRYEGSAYVYLTKSAFGENSTVKVTDNNPDDLINYSLSYGDGTTYLASVGGYSAETFVLTDGTYNYSASTREQGISIVSGVATYIPSVGDGKTFSITNLADGLTVESGKALIKGTTTEVGEISGTTFTLTSLSALSAAAQYLGATTTFKLTNTGTGNYSLSVGGDLAVGTASAIAANLTGVSGVYTYAAAHNGAYVAKADTNSYTYNAEAKHDNFELSGTGLASGLSLGDLSINGKNVSLKASAINASVSAGDTIVFDGDTDGDGNYYTIAALSAREKKDEYFAGNGTALAYHDKSTLAGWDGASGSTATFTYSDVTGGASLFTVNGLSAAYTGASVKYFVDEGTGSLRADTEYIGSFGASTLTLNATALAGASFVNLSGSGYNLELTGVAQSAAVIAEAGFSGAVYSASAIDKYWSASGTNAYTLNPSVEGAAQFSIAGATALANSIVSGTTVNIGEANLTGTSVTLTNLSSAGYSLALDGDYAQKTTAGGFGSLTGGAATYYGEGKSDGYSLTSTTQITYAKGQSGAALFTASDITSTKNVNYAASAITATNEAKAKLTLTNLSSALTIDGFVGITGLNATNQTVAGTPTDAKADGSNLVVTTADGAITIDGAAKTTVNMASAGASYTAAFDRITDVTDENAKSVTLTAGFTNNYYGLHYSYSNGVTAVDATKADITTLTLTGSKQTDDLTLTGASAAANTVIGGKGNDTLTGGGQNDSLKGNAGNDVFVQSAGTDTITDYTENEDTIQLLGTLANTAADSLNNVTLNTADGNAIVIENGVGQVIKTVDNKANEGYTLYLPEAPTNASVSGEDLVVTADKDYTFAGAAAATVTVYTSNGGTFTAEQTRITDITDGDTDKKVTLTAGFTNNYYGLHYSYANGVKAVDATKADTTTLTLTGSKQSDDLTLTGASAAANTVIGGKGNDTITGGGQNDSLKGNAGNDVFIQSAGDDTIGDYTAGEDAIQLLSTETGRETVSTDVVITTAEGTIHILNGVGKDISIISGAPVASGTPIDSKAEGDDLLVTLAGNKTTTYSGQGNDTVTMSAGGHNYSVTSDRITDFTDGDDDKKVTLTAGFDGTYYGLHQKSYANGVTAVDASKATSISTLTLTGYKQTDDLTLTGAPNAANTVIGGKGNDTITGGGQNDSLKGNAGNDLFVQSAGNDTIADYTAGEDVISLVSAYNNNGSVSGNDVILTTEDGNTILVTGGKGQTITTTYQGTTDTLFFSGETPVIENAPVDVTLAGGVLSIQLANDSIVTAQSESTILTAGDNSYSVTADRITDITDESDKKVTLASGFTNAYYNLNQGYASGVTKVDASKANSTKLTMTGSKQTADLNLKGSNNVGTNITGGTGNDTITGGDLNDTLNGGSAGNDVFVQSGGNDTITNYTGGEDVISLGSALTATATDETNVTLTTAEGTIIIRKGADQAITTVVDDKESTAMFLSAAPTNASVNGSDLVVTTSNGNFTIGGASDTVTMYAGDKTYTAAADRITDVTTSDAKAVTLTSGFENDYYGMHYSYSDGVTTVDATDANTTSLTITGFKSKVALNLKGADKAANNVIGGHGNDTLMGGTGDDSLKGNAGADLFIQSKGNDTILDYAAEDTIQLASEAESSVDGEDILFTNTMGTIRVSLGSGLDINTVVGGDANFATNDDELWGINGVKDTFLFDGGKDTIHNYEEQDSIDLKGFALSDLVSGAPSVKDNSLIFAFDKKNSFTVVDAFDKNISFTDGTSYSRNKK